MDNQKLCKSELYKEGSEACRNYSRLTMQVRTLSQQVLVAAMVALAVASIGKEAIGEGTLPREFLGYISFYAGLVLSGFGISLGLVDWHYQSAFTAMRDSLAELEGQRQHPGPWSAHSLVRNPKRDDFIASYFPFWLLCLIGTASSIYGIVLINQHTWWSYSILGIACLIIARVFLYIYKHPGNQCSKNQNK